MSYTLSRLAPGSYDVLLDGVIIAGVVRAGRADAGSWIAELLLDLPPDRRPAPFTSIEHTFGSLDEVRSWLGDAQISDAAGEG